MSSSLRNKQPVSISADDQLIFDKWKPPSLFKGAILFFIIGIYLLIVGIIFQLENKDIKFYKDQYTIDDDREVTCPVDFGTSCLEINFSIQDTIKSPVHFFYELSNFNQNHKKYLESIDVAQLFDGQSKSPSSCDPFITNSQMKKTEAVDGSPLEGSEVAIPCGLRAKTFFQDDYRFYRVNSDSSKDLIQIDESNIAWPEDRSSYKNIDLSKQWIDLETNEHFMVWVRPAPLSKFKKLWGRIYKDLEPGNYQLLIDNTFNNTYYSAKKYFIFAELTDLGYKNQVLTVGHLLSGSVFIIFGIVFVVIKLKFKN